MVTGSSEMEITPDEIYMNFTIQEYKNKAGKKVTIQEVTTQFLGLCKKSGLDRNAVENFYLVRTSHSQLEKLRRKVKENAVKASKTKAIYLAKAVGEEVGSALLIEEITEGDVDSDQRKVYKYKEFNSNTVTSGSLGSGYSSVSPSLDKIKIRFEVKAEYELD